ncbi:hypothetical protein ACQJBY_062931 [Aegilops geniculata]
MGTPMSKLSESNMQFHVVIPGKKAESLGQIALDVVFGDSKNYRKEKLTFEVVDFHSAYHAILGRPAYAHFMARPCYVYLKLKMPGPRGVITVTGNQQRAEECLQKGSKIADEQMVAVELEEYKKSADPSELLRAKKPALESSFQSAGETKPVQIHPEDPFAAPTHISTTLDSKQEEALIKFLRENWDIFAWKPSDMPGVPRGLAEHRLRVDPKRDLSRNISVGPLWRKGRQLARKWLGSCQLSSFARYNTPSGSPMSSWSPRKMIHSICVLTSSISIGPARKIIFLSLASIRLSTRLRGVNVCPFWMHIPGTIRSDCMGPMK